EDAVGGLGQPLPRVCSRACEAAELVRTEPDVDGIRGEDVDDADADRRADDGKPNVPLRVPGLLCEWGCRLETGERENRVDGASDDACDPVVRAGRMGGAEDVEA